MHLAVLAAASLRYISEMHLRVDRGAQLSAARMAELACYENTSWICWVIEMHLGPSSDSVA
jgi:hypothetical protein